MLFVSDFKFKDISFSVEECCLNVQITEVHVHSEFIQIVPASFRKCNTLEGRDIILNFRQGNFWRTGELIFRNWMAWSQTTSTKWSRQIKRKKPQQLKWQRKNPTNAFEECDFPLPCWFLLGVNPNISTSKPWDTKFIMLKATNFRSWNPIHELAQKAMPFKDDP